MGKMYFDFITNLPNSNKKPTVQVENISFRTPGGVEIMVGCNGWSDFGVEEGLYSARFKGLEYYAEKDGDSTPICDWEDQPTVELLKMLEKSTIVGIHFFWDEEFNIPEGLLPTCKDLDVEIEQYIDAENVFQIEFHADDVTPDYTVD